MYIDDFFFIAQHFIPNWAIPVFSFTPHALTFSHCRHRRRRRRPKDLENVCVEFELWVIQKKTIVIKIYTQTYLLIVRARIYSEVLP